MRARWAVAVSLLAVLTTGCAATVAGSGVRQAMAAGGGGSQASGASIAGSGQPPTAHSGDATPSSPAVSQVRPMPPIPAGGTGDASSPSTVTTPQAPPSTTQRSGGSAPETGGSAIATGSGSQGGPVSQGGSPAPGTGSADPTAEFDGATAVDPTKFPGLVTDVGFGSPSGNITCGIGPAAVVCQIGTFDYTPPKHDCGASGWGSNVRLKPTGSAELFCAGDVESGGPTLGYGLRITVGDMRCVSRQDGVTCQNTASGNGFRLSRAAYTIFGPAGSHTIGAPNHATATTVPSALVGQWSGHGRQVTISSAGSATLTYRAYRTCSDDPTPPCDTVSGNQIRPGGYLAFDLTAATGTHAATGTVTASNDPKTPVGTAVTATVSGYDLQLSIWPGTPFCAANTPADRWDCGA